VSASPPLKRLLESVAAELHSAEQALAEGNLSLALTSMHRAGSYESAAINYVHQAAGIERANQLALRLHAATQDVARRAERYACTRKRGLAAGRKRKR
jgi:hypothetical protein